MKSIQNFVGSLGQTHLRCKENTVIGLDQHSSGWSVSGEHWDNDVEFKRQDKMSQFECILGDVNSVSLFYKCSNGN